MLFQGVVLNKSNIDGFLQSVTKKLESLECTLAESFGKLVENSSVSINKMDLNIIILLHNVLFLPNHIDRFLFSPEKHILWVR